MYSILQSMTCAIYTFQTIHHGLLKMLIQYHFYFFNAILFKFYSRRLCLELLVMSDVMANL